MGRVVNNVCSMLVTAPAVAIILSQNVLAAVGAALVMFVGIAITLLGQLGQQADDVVMQDGLALATDDLGGDFASTCSDSARVEAAELRCIVETALKSLRLSCGSELTRQGISLP